MRMALLLVLCLTTAAVAAAPARGGSSIPAITAAMSGDNLVLTFPPSTIHNSVSFTAHGMKISQCEIACHHRAYKWTSDTELSIDLKRSHRHHHGAYHSTEMWVWGQLKNGDMLLQKVAVNP